MSDDRTEREKFAHDAMSKDLKKHYEKQGNYNITGEQIENEVKEIAKEVERNKEHPIYQK
jgi:transcriptional regulator NrdR family protein